MEKIYLVQQESNDDGQVYFSSTPCVTMEIAKRVMNEKVNKLGEHPKYQGLDIDNPSDEYEVDKDDLSININLPYDDYYEYIYIESKTILEN